MNIPSNLAPKVEGKKFIWRRWEELNYKSNFQVKYICIESTIMQVELPLFKREKKFPTIKNIFFDT